MNGHGHGNGKEIEGKGVSNGMEIGDEEGWGKV